VNGEEDELSKQTVRAVGGCLFKQTCTCSCRSNAAERDVGPRTSRVVCQAMVKVRWSLLRCVQGRGSVAYLYMYMYQASVVMSM